MKRNNFPSSKTSSRHLHQDKCLLRCTVKNVEVKKFKVFCFFIEIQKLDWMYSADLFVYIFSTSLKDQVYSNTRVPIQVNTSEHESTGVNTNQYESDTNQHESNPSQHESTWVRRESTRINTRPTRVKLDQETIIVYRSFSW